MTILDIKHILSNRNYSDELWRNKLKTKSKDHYFLLAFCNVFEYVFQQLKSFLASCAYLVGRIKSEVLEKMVFVDVTTKLKPLILRIYVYELHLAREKNQLQGKKSAERFEWFINWIQNPKQTCGLLAKYPVLEYLINSFIQQYLFATNEFLHRLNIDLNSLQHEFLLGDNYEISEIERSLAEVHKRHRTVILVAFVYGKSSCKIVYKPRSLAVESAFYQFLNWIKLKIKLPHYSPRYVLRKDYGWVEFIARCSCKTHQQLKDFYWREGSLLAICYLLLGSDMHYENIIAHGEYPVLIDLECLLRPSLNNKFVEKFLVSETHWLPQLQRVRVDQEGVDLSALGAGKQKSMYEGLAIREPGLDTMYLARQVFCWETKQHLPSLNEKEVIFNDYAQDFFAGFEMTYQVFLLCQKDLLSKNTPLKCFRNKEIRLVMRPTAEYGKLLSESYHPSLLSDVTKFHQHFSWLHEKIKYIKPLAHIIQSEFKDLLLGNIPFFTILTIGKQVLDANGNNVSLKIKKTSYSRLLSHVESLSEADLRLQMTIIKQSIAAYNYNKTGITLNSSSFELAYNKKGNKNFNSFAFNQPRQKINVLMTAAKVFAKCELDKLAAIAFQQDEDIYWPTLELHSNNSCLTGFTNTSLYSGISGIMLTFAYAAIIYSEQEYYQITAQCLQSLRKMLATAENRVFNLGAFSGLGGIIYALYKLFCLWGDPEIIADIKNILNLSEFSFITSVSSLDLVSGIAGFLVILLRIKSIASSVQWEKIFHGCINSILEKYPEPAEFSAASSTSLVSNPQIGFAHGTTGIIWAFTKARKYYSESKLNEWIRKALLYERQCFNFEKNNWPSFLKSMQNQPYVLQWCYGAPGIGLARFDMLADGWQDDFIRIETQNAVEATIKNGFGNHLNLCHGDLGNLEILWACKTNRSQNKYWYSVNQIIQRIQSGEIVCNELGNVMTPSLMSGNAGLAYQLMRIASPEIVPNVLLLQ